MIKCYESFSEIAKDFVDGESWTHQLSHHTSANCLPWQQGIQEFARFLDKLPFPFQDKIIYDKLWELAKV